MYCNSTYDIFTFKLLLATFAETMIVFLTILLSFGLGLSGHYQKLVPPTPTTAAKFPYHAIIETAGWWCNGIIVSDNYILTRASCVIQGKETLIYLGATQNPSVKTNKQIQNSEVQIFHGTEVLIHREFGNVTELNQFINNIALIKLHKPLIRTTTVQPVLLPSPEDYPIPPGTYMNATGFPSLEYDGNLHYATVQMRDMDSCKVFFGESFLEIEERCVRQKGTKRNTWVGPYVVNGVLLGLQRSLHANAKCYVSTPPCSIHDVFFSLEYFLEWIYRKSGAKGEGASYFDYDNPYWEYRPVRVHREIISKMKDSILDLQVNVQTCKANQNAFVEALRAAINKGIEKNVKNISINIELV